MNEAKALLLSRPDSEPLASNEEESLKSVVYRGLVVNTMRCTSRSVPPFPHAAEQLTGCIDGVLSKSAGCVGPLQDNDEVRAMVSPFLLETLRNMGKGTRIAVIRSILDDFVPADKKRVFSARRMRALGVGMCILVEGIHNLSLIVDDCVDRDSLRRGKPTLYSAFGVRGVVPAAHMMAESLFHAIDGLPIDEQSRAFISTTFVDTSRIVADAIISEIVWDCEPVEIPWDAIDRSSIERIYLAKTSAIINLVIDWISYVFRLDSGAMTQVQHIVSQLGLFLQSVNDLENFSATKGGSCPNLDRYSDIRRRRITPLSLSCVGGKGSESYELRKLAYAPHADSRSIDAYIAALGTCGAIHDEVARLRRDKKSIEDAIRVASFSEGTKLRITNVLNKYACPLEGIGQ